MRVFGGVTASKDTQLKRDVDKVLASKDTPAKWVIQITQNFVGGGRKGVHAMSLLQVFRCTNLGFGAADQMVRWCVVDGCMGVIPDAIELTSAEIDMLVKKGIRHKPTQWPMHLQKRVVDSAEQLTMCPKCSNIAVRDTLPDANRWQVSNGELAGVLDSLWQDFHGEAEFYLVRTKATGNIHKARALYSNTGGLMDEHKAEYKSLIESERDREQVHYKLSRLMKDIESGKTVARAIQDLLEA